MKFDQKVVDDFRVAYRVDPAYKWDGEQFLAPCKHFGTTINIGSLCSTAQLIAWVDSKQFYQDRREGELFTCPRCHGRCEHDYQKMDAPITLETHGDRSFECSHCKGDGYVPFGLLIKKQPKEDIRDFDKITGIMKMAGVTDFGHGMKDSIPFKLGDKFTTLMGTEVSCMEISDTRGYECARFSDGGWRYNRGHDRGRCTGSRWDDPLNILPKFPEV